MPYVTISTEDRSGNRREFVLEANTTFELALQITGINPGPDETVGVTNASGRPLTSFTGRIMKMGDVITVRGPATERAMLEPEVAQETAEPAPLARDAAVAATPTPRNVPSQFIVICDPGRPLTMHDTVDEANRAASADVTLEGASIAMVYKAIRRYTPPARTAVVEEL